MGLDGAQSGQRGLRNGGASGHRIRAKKSPVGIPRGEGLAYLSAVPCEGRKRHEGDE